MAIFQVNSIDIWTNPSQPDQALIPDTQIYFDSDTQKIGCTDVPVSDTDFTNKAYVDQAIETAISALRLKESGQS
jgi:hypothetical protein